MIERGIIKLLKEIASMAEEASLTGSMEGGAARTVQRYNATLNTLRQKGVVPEGLFSALPENAAFGEVGVEAKMLVGYLKGVDDGGDDDEPHKHKNKRGDLSILTRLAPFVDSKDLRDLISQYSTQNMTLDPDTLAQLAPFLDRESLGQLIQQHMIPHLRPMTPADPEPAPTRAPAPAPPAPRRETLSDLVTRLQQRDVSEEERQRLLARIAEFA